MNKTECSIVLNTGTSSSSSSVIHSHIPVPRISTAIKAQERCPPNRRGSFEKFCRVPGSVAAKTASFEKLDASVQSRSRTNNNTNNNNHHNHPSMSISSIEVRNSDASVVQLRSRNNHHQNNHQLSTSSIEVRNSDEKPTPASSHRTNVVEFNRSNSFLENKWKTKYEESEKKRKLLLQKIEAGNTNILYTYITENYNFKLNFFQVKLPS